MAIVLQDDFNEADGTNLSGKSLDVGGTWTVGTGAADVNGARARQTSATYTNMVAYGDAGETDETAIAVLNVAADAFDLAGIAARVTDSNDYWLVGASPTRDLLYVYENVAGVFTERSSAVWSGNTATDYALTVTTSGTSITGQIGATSVNYGSMSTGGSATMWGIWSNIQGTKFDDFQVGDEAATGNRRRRLLLTRAAA